MFNITKNANKYVEIYSTYNYKVEMSISKNR